MANNSCQRSDGSSNRSSFPAKGPHFFKIIHSGIVHDQNLRIPTKFMKKYGKDLSNLAFLKVPSGEEWQVKLMNSNGKVWLYDGWQNFKKHYSIGLGHFLVFRYDGNSYFHVLIFDMSASEIEYPLRATHGGQTNLNEERQVPKTEVIEIDDSVENVDGLPTCQTTRDKEQIEKDVSVENLDDFQTGRAKRKATPSSQMMINNLTCKTENSTNLETLFPNFLQMNGVKLAKSSTDGDLHHLTREIKMIADDKVTALQRADAFKSGNPFFKVFMHPYYVSNKSNLNIPLIFSKKYFSDKQNITLRVWDGRAWSVKCYFGTCNAKLCCGWSSFVQANNIEVGDVCVFELIKGIEPWLKVIIFRAVEEAKCCLPMDWSDLKH